MRTPGVVMLLMLSAQSLELGYISGSLGGFFSFPHGNFSYFLSKILSPLDLCLRPMVKILIIFTGLPISKVEFPSVVICSQGINIEAMVAAIYYYILKRLKTTTQQQFNFTPLQTANLTIRSLREVWYLDI